MYYFMQNKCTCKYVYLQRMSRNLQKPIYEEHSLCKQLTTQNKKMWKGYDQNLIK